MPRLHGVDIPGDKKLEYSLRYIYGVGPTRARIICEKCELDPNLRAHTLSEEQLNSISQVIIELKYVTEGDLRREVTANLKRLQAIRCYRGIRHQRGLPVRGQRTQTNARTRKGAPKTVGVASKQR